MGWAKSAYAGANDTSPDGEKANPEGDVYLIKKVPLSVRVDR